MKICWDTLENLRLIKSGKFKDITKKGNNYYHLCKCKICKKDFLGRKKEIKICSKKCLGKSQRGKNNPRYGDHRNFEELHGKEKAYKLKENISRLYTGKNHPNYGKEHWSKTDEKWKAEKLKKFKNNIEIANYKLLDEEWKGSYSYYKVKCPMGHIYKTKTGYFYSGKRCPKCYKSKQFDIQEIKEYITERGYRILEWSYKNNKSKIKLKCNKCKRGFYINWNRFYFTKTYKEGNGCYKCFGNYGKTPYNKIKNFIENENYILLTTEDNYNTNKLKVQCPEGHIFYPSWGNFYRGGTRCPFCQPNYKKTYQEIKESYESDNYTLLTTENDYKNTNSYVKVRCDKGHEYESKVSYFLAGNRCPMCWWDSTSSEVEREIQEYTKTLVENVVCNDRTIITNPKTEEGLELDIWFPDLRKAIEYNGIYWHTKDLGTKQRDTIKKNQCKKNSIELLVVWENEFLESKQHVFNNIKNFLIGEE